MSASDGVEPQPRAAAAPEASGVPLLRLLPQHQAKLDASAILGDVAAERGYESALEPGDLRRRGFKGAQAKRTPGLLIPWWSYTVTTAPVLWQNRPDDPREFDGKVVKYEYPNGAAPVLDCHPRVRPDVADVTRELWITESVLKADALIGAGISALAMCGAWGFRGHDVSNNPQVIPGFRDVPWLRRPVVIALDANVVSNPMVRAAARALRDVLMGLGAIVRYLALPEPVDG